MLLSIIIPTYNSENYIQTTLSQLEQMTNFVQIEIIIVDDGSDDKTVELAKESLKSFSGRSIFIVNKHAGVSHSRNTGISVATGKYVTFIDADDLIVIQGYKNVVNYIENTDKEISLISTSTFVKESHSGETFQSREIDKLRRINLGIQTEGFLNQEFFPGPVAKFYLLKIITNLNFPETFSNGEDMIFNNLVLENSTNVVLMKERLYLYRQHNNSLMNKVTDDFLIMNERFLREIKRSVNFNDKETKKKVVCLWQVKLALTNFIRFYYVKDYRANYIYMLNDKQIVKKNLMISSLIKPNFSINQQIILFLIAWFPSKFTLFIIKIIKRFRKSSEFKEI